MLRLRGGAKKRKKKNYTTPKKQKHKHKKVKLAVLKYYRVDDNGKINRLRRECPSEECGAGVFMVRFFCLELFCFQNYNIIKNINTCASFFMSEEVSI